MTDLYRLYRPKINSLNCVQSNLTLMHMRTNPDLSFRKKKDGAMLKQLNAGAQPNILQRKYDKQTHWWEPRREKCFEYIVEFLCVLAVFIFRLLRWPKRCSRKGQKGGKSLCWHVCLRPAMLSSSARAQAQIPQVLVTWERRETDEEGGENVFNLSEGPRLWLWNKHFRVWESCLGSSGQTVEEVKFQVKSE